MSQVPVDMSLWKALFVLIVAGAWLYFRDDIRKVVGI